MKLHDLRPPEGSNKARTRVGRGIAAGKGKTAGRGTKGQKARAGGSIPPWFEGGQTPLHMRIPKLRGFKNRFKIEYEVVNVGAIGALAERGAFEVEAPKGAKGKAADGADHDQPGHPAGRRPRADPGQAAQDPRRRRPVRAAVRGRRRVHRVGPDQDRGGRRIGQRARGPDHGHAGARPRAEGRRPQAGRAEGRGDGRDADAEPRREAVEADATAEPRAEPERRRPKRPSPRRPRRRPKPPRPPKAAAAKAAKPAKAPRAKAAKAEASAAADEAPADEPTDRVRRRRDPCRRRLTRVRIPAERLPGAGHPAPDPVRPRTADRLPPARGRAGPGHRQGRSSQQFVDENPLFGLLDLFSGGGLATFSVVALGMNPYINSSIIMQLMQGVVPSLQALSREGEYGRNKINQYTRYLTVPMAMLQAYGFLALLNSRGVLTGGFDLASFTTLTQIATLTAGAIALMWIGELITERGIGNGISFIIFAGIVSRAPVGDQRVPRQPEHRGLRRSWASWRSPRSR